MIEPYQIVEVCGIALLGTLLGGKFLDKTDDKNFQLWSKRIVLWIGLVYLGRGLYLIFEKLGKFY